MKKTILLCVVVLALAASGAWAKQKDIGIGVEYVYSYGSFGGVSGITITGSPPKLPIVFGLNLGFGGTYFNLGITGDWWLYQKGIAGPLAMYAGPGLFLNFNVSGGAYVAFGARGVIGLQLFPIEPLELFVEAGLNVGVSIAGTVGLAWGIPIAIGGRFWF